LGSSVAQELLARDATSAGRLRSVVLLNGGIIPSAHRPILMQRLLAHTIIGSMLKHVIAHPALFRGSLNRIFGPRSQLSETEAAEHFALFTHKEGHLVVDRLLGYIAERSVHAERWVGALFSTGVPVALINGPADPVSGAHLVEAFQGERQRRLENATRLGPSVANARSLDSVVVLDSSVGHYPQIERPEAVIDAVLAFAERVAGGRVATAE
jgi:pimeloyl-ACP methyl ester carboxylesterase